MRQVAAFLGGMVLAATAGPLLIASPAERGVLMETWLGIEGGSVTDLTGHARYGQAPDAVRVLDRFEAESTGDECGSRLSALLTPPATGDYTFWIASDDGGQLELSTNDAAANCRRIAVVNGYTGPKEWTAQPGQQSKPVRLEKGKAYYLRGLHKDVGGIDHVAVAWQGPGIERQVIGGRHLALPKLDAKLAALVEATRTRERDMAGLQQRAGELMEKGETLPAELAARLPEACEAPPRGDTGINILLDQAHQTYFIALWGLRGQLRGEGFRACTSLATLDSVLKRGGQSRIRLRVGELEPFAWWPNAEFNVVITTQHDVDAQPYTPQERDSLRGFVETGGGLLILAGRPRDEATAGRWSMNALAGDYGARFTSEAARYGGRSCSTLKLEGPWEVQVRGEGDRPVRARRAFGKGRVAICEAIQSILPDKEDDRELKQRKDNLLRETVAWLAAGKKPIGGAGRLPATGGAGIFPERELNLGGVVVYYAGNQPPKTMECIQKDIPSAARQIRAWLPSKVYGEPYNLVICAGGGGGWAINPRPKAAAVIDYEPLGLLGVFAHEMAHTMAGPLNDKGAPAGVSPHGNQGEAHAGWFQGKILALYGGRTNQANRDCNPILAREKAAGDRIDLARYDAAKWGKGADWTKLWWVWQKLDDRYGPTWYPRWYWVRAMRWRDEPGRRETWDEMVEDMSIAVGEDLFPFFRKIGTTLAKDRLERIGFQGATLELPTSPLEAGPAGNVCLDPILDHTKPLPGPKKTAQASGPPSAAK